VQATILINSGEHSFSTNPEEPVKSITVKDQDVFTLTLFDGEGNSEDFEIPNCKVITVEGAKFKEEVVISKSLIFSFEVEKTEEEEVIEVELLNDSDIWESGFAQGYFFDVETIPAKLRDIELG
jgi:hypothetical protein